MRGNLTTEGKYEQPQFPRFPSLPRLRRRPPSLRESNISDQPPKSGLPPKSDILEKIKLHFGRVQQTSEATRPQPDTKISQPLAYEKGKYTSGDTEFVVEGSVDGIPVSAFPDTAASDESLISPRYAELVGKTPVPGTAKEITLANKSTVYSPGMIEVEYEFEDKATSHMLKSYILPGCVHDFVLGLPFLRASRTLDKFKHRIKKVLNSSRLRLRYMGEGKERMLGMFNNQITMALADTGSDLMLVSSDYARQCGLVIKTGRKHRKEVELADGTRTWTRGVVSRVPWTVGNDPVLCDFHVMHDLPAHVILSKSYLFERDVFSNHSESFFNIDSVEDISLLCGIRLIEKELYDLEKLESDFLRDVTSQEAFDFEAEKRERIRRTLAAKKIATLSLAERPGVLHREEQKKQRWNTARTQHRILWNTSNSRR